MKFCCYGAASWNIGKVVGKHTAEAVSIQYYPNQMYPPELWDGAYVKIFKNFKEAKKFYLQETSLENRRMSVIKDWEKYLLTEKKLLEIKHFIGAYLIPAYESEYVDSQLRRDFYKIVDEAEKNYTEMEL